MRAEVCVRMALGDPEMPAGQIPTRRLTFRFWDNPRELATLCRAQLWSGKMGNGAWEYA